MKKAALILLMAAGLAACKKEDKKDNTPNYTCTTCVAAPEANAAYDNSSAGVYKGVLVGSSGNIALYLYNTGTQVTALVTFDGKSGTLATNDLNSWTPGQAVSNALFTGVIEGTQIEALFSVDANGQNPSLQVNIPGHDVTVAVYKETSTTLIKSFEGTYTGDDEGVFNITFNGNDFSLVASGSDGTVIEGTLDNGAVNLAHDGVTIKGSFKGTDEIQGTWSDGNGKQGTWSGKRTM